MTHTKVNYRDVEPVASGLHFLREPLGLTNVGFSVRTMDPGETGKEHDHGHDDQEEVYFLVEGALTVTVDGETIALEPGDALRVSPGATRLVQNGDGESTLVIVGAP